VVDERTRDMLKLVELDYGQTSEFVRGVLSTATTIRGWAITIWLALAGFSVQQDQWILSALGLVVASSFYMMDAYHLSLYRQGLKHLQSLERLYADYYSALSRAEFDPGALDEFLIDLETHRFGFYRRLAPFSLERSIKAGPRVFVALYAVLVAVSIGLAILELTTKLGT
jgi:hypothetical protein